MSSEAQEESGNELTRVTINLVPPAADALASSTARERLSKTDVVNRALRMYDFLSASTAAGCEVVVRRPHGEMEVVHFI